MSPARPKRMQQSRQSVRNRLPACFHRDHTSFEYLPNRTADIWRCGRYRLYLRYRPHRFPRHFNQPGAIFLEESGRRGNRTRVSEHVRGVAIPLGRLKPSHRMVALPMLRDATGPVHFLPTCRTRLSSKGGFNPRPLSTTINIHGRRIYGKEQSYIRLRIHDIRAIAKFDIEREKRKGGPPSFTPNGPPCHILLAVLRIG